MRILAVLLFLAAPTLLLAQDKAPKKVDFATQIWPILEKRCVECHSAPHTENGRTKKPKGGVTLDSKDGITSSKRGKLVVAKKPDDSLLLQSVTLPADDEDRMPPAKKGEPLSKAQTDLIKAWIEGGADFGKWTGKAKADEKKDGDKEEKGDEKGSEKGKDDPKPRGSGDKKKGDPLPKLMAGVRALDEKVLAAFDDGNFTVKPFAPDCPLLTVTCAGHTDDVDDAAVRALAPIADHIVELDLARSRVGDGACEVIAKMPRLLYLDLRQTAVANGITALTACKELRSINLFGTRVGDYGMAALASCKHLDDVYVWQTEVSPSAALRLREALPDVRVVVAPDLPEPMAEGGGAKKRR
ncbi:MAG: hypothetical protein H6838_16360 [Planctomycetes bacterium]|nr:hypothetical protein [Planctomycetota bacterium]MCB9887066.1 hypothetical protein [Planctomycetota bacterium]